MATDEQDRCWPGYEPVPGKPEHSQGSCRPKADSKMTSSEKQFRQKRKKQLAGWKAGHPGTSTSAAQHLHAPAEPPAKSSKKNAPAKKVTAKKAVAKKAVAKKATTKK